MAEWEASFFLTKAEKNYNNHKTAGNDKSCKVPDVADFQ